jgi:transcriptional regulator with XRE-family HTH domain
MPTGDNPVSQQRKLRAELRQLRDALGLTQKDVADALDWSPSKLIRIEKGSVGVSVTDVRALLQHYGVTDAGRVAELVGMARASKKPAWWHEYRDTSTPQFLTFLGLEASSIRIRQFQGLVMPGLLQHSDYAAALVRNPKPDPVVADRAVQIRMARQELLDDEDRESFFIIDEAALRRVIGSPAVMVTQLRKLIEIAGKPNVTIQVVPFSAGAHMGMKGSFVIMELSDVKDDYAMLLEQPYVDRLIEEASVETREYINIFHELEKISLPQAESLKLVERVLTSFEEES